MDRRLRVSIVTNLYPNQAAPGFAPFNRQQFRALGELADLEIHAVIPWHPGRALGRRGRSAVPRTERLDGFTVEHPRFLAIPGLPSLNAASLAARLWPGFLRRPRPDVLLAAYAYPDGCAGVLLGQALRVPVVVKCHGSDLNRVPEDLPARLQLQALLPRAERVVVVSQKLGEAARGLGVDPARLRLVYNGVDRDRFSVGDRAQAQRALGLPQDRPIVLYVGHLAEHKGALDLAQAAERLEAQGSKALVVLVGDGPLLAELQARAERASNLRVVGRVPHAEVPSYLAACDLLCLPSWDEGLPNVVREAHASGRPVVATRVGGIPEAVHRPELGHLVEPRQPEALAEALGAQLASSPSPAATIVELAVVPSWPESAAQLHQVLLEAARGRS